MMAVGGLPRGLLLLLLLLSGATAAARPTKRPSDAAKNARAHKLISLPSLGALDGLPPDDPASLCKVPILPGGESSAFAKRINEFRAEYSDAANWTAAVLKRVKKRQKHAQLLKDHKAFTPVKGEDDVEDANYGAYIQQLDALHQQVKAESPEDGNTWRARLTGFSLKDRFNYKIAFVGYAGAGESARKLYERLETSVKTFGQADSITFWTKDQVLTHHEKQQQGGGGVAPTPGGAMHTLYEQDPDNGHWGWKPAIILAALQRAKYGDFVVYADASQLFGEGVKHSFVPLCDWLTVAMTGAHGEEGLRVGGMAAGMRLRVRNNSPPSRRWFWDNACNMCRTLVQGGMCNDEEGEVSAKDGRGEGGGDGGGAGGSDGGGGGDGGGSDGGGGIEGCCSRAYRSPHVQASFSVWQKNPRTMKFLELWRDLVLAKVYNPAGDDNGILTALATALNLAVPYARYDTPHTGPINNDAKDPNLLFAAFAEGNPLPWLRPEDGYPECEAGEAGAGDSAGGDGALDVWTECCPDHYRDCMPAARDTAASDYEKRMKACLTERHPHNQCAAAGAGAGEAGDATTAATADVGE